MTASSTVDVALAATIERWAAERRTGWIRAVGRSMEPLVRAGDELLVAFGDRDVAVGDVLVVPRRGRFLAHRLVAIVDAPDGRRYTTKGDAEADADPAVAPAEILGVALAVRRPDGRQSDLARGRPARVVATVSRMTGRVARRARRSARHLPAPIAPAMSTALMGLAQLPLRLILAPLART